MGELINMAKKKETCVGNKIRHLKKSGFPQKQAVPIALKQCGKSKKK